MSWILLTNDDGADSPALPPFARALAAHTEVRVVVPATERSWTGKAISRADEITVTRTSRDGVPVYACSGYPADAAQLGIHALFDDGPPQLVVSGINVGFNHGTAFLLSSGTVGAAMEGWISGLPAVAFSTGHMPSSTATDFATWRQHALSTDSTAAWSRLATVCADLLGDLTASGLTELADVVSVNLPFDADADTERRLTTVARVGYDRLFRGLGGDRFVHDFTGLLEFGALAGTDLAAAGEGCVSITPLELPRAIAVPDGLAGRLRATAPSSAG